MSRLMLDTNTLLDLLSFDRPAHAEVQALFEAAAADEDCGLYALASSLKDVYYSYARHYGSERIARQDVRLFCELLELCPCDAELVTLALASDEPDLEDGLVRCAAERNHLDGIVSRDAGAFVGSGIPKLSIAEALELLREGKARHA